MAKMRHIAIRSDDLEAACKFYTSVFELKEVERVGDVKTNGAIYLSDGTINVALIRMEDPKHPNYRPFGLSHVGWVVDDMKAAIARATAAGAICEVDPDDQHAGVTWEMKMKAPDGTQFDFSTHGWPGIAK